MATYTDNYTMTKPTYAEQADISVINANMDIIDNVMHSSQISLAPAYDLNETYNTGDVVMYELLMYKCLADNVTGAWDSTKWERTTASETGGGTEFDLYGEASGTAEASFSDGAEASLVECEIGIEPQQDLHGYSKPWAGGAGKNKLDCSNATSGSLYGVNFTVNKNTDGAVNSIDASNTATSSLYYEIFRGSLTFDSDVILSGCPSGGSLQTYGLLYNNGIGAEYGTGTTIPAGTTITSIGIRIGNGYTANNVTFKPMIRLATETDSTFTPYSNICPITGHTDVTVTVASTSGGSGDDTTVSLGRTVYSGTLDVTTGELVVTHKLETGFTRGATDSSGKLYSLNTPADILAWTEAGTADILSNYLPPDNLNNARLNNTKSIVLYATTLYVGGYVGDETTLDGFLPTLQVYYPLATPQTFTLTPTQVLTLLGQNYVSHDGGGTISLVYIKKDSTIIPNPSDAEVPLTGLEISGKDFVITDARIPAPPTTNGAYVLTVTVSGGTPTYSWENA